MLRSCKLCSVVKREDLIQTGAMMKQRYHFHITLIIKRFYRDPSPDGWERILAGPALINKRENPVVITVLNLVVCICSSAYGLIHVAEQPITVVSLTVGLPRQFNVISQLENLRQALTSTTKNTHYGLKVDGQYFYGYWHLYLDSFTIYIVIINATIDHFL